MTFSFTVSALFCSVDCVEYHLKLNIKLQSEHICAECKFICAGSNDVK